MAAEWLWGLVLVATGVFVCIYGTAFFRFALPVIGFVVGALLALRVTAGGELPVRLLAAAAAGGVGVLVVAARARIGPALAGGVLGLVVGLLVAALIGAFGADPPNPIVVVLALVGVVGGAVLGPRLGNAVIGLASAAAGAIMIVNGLHVLFASKFTGEPTDALQSLGQLFGLVLFAVFFAMSVLSQRIDQDSRQREIG